MNRRTWQLLTEYMHACMQDSAHDREHVLRVLHNALNIAAHEENVNLDVLIAACLLHDISRAEQMADPSICHALHGGDKAYAFLIKTDFPSDFAEHVRQCIRTHRFRKSMPPATVEARILFDADKLDVCGAIGIARTLMYNGAAGSPMYSRLPDGAVSDGSGDTADSFCREYRFKLEGMYDRFLTRRGAELAAQRQRAAQNFYAALMQEVQSGEQAAQRMLDQILTDA